MIWRFSVGRARARTGLLVGAAYTFSTVFTEQNPTDYFYAGWYVLRVWPSVDGHHTT